MPDFNPSPRDRITIGGLSYTVMPHPAVSSFAFGQEGRKAFVYQISGGPDGGLYALKKFKAAFRLAELDEICDKLARFAQWPGLEVCARECLTADKHGDILKIHTDLEYAVLMPWISGSTWYDMVIGMTPLSRVEAATFANAVAQVLAALEESGLAHCDISAANVIINPTSQRAHLIDIEDLFAPDFDEPAAVPAGTDGYAHRTASQGLWGLHADRFAGAILICEMAAWHHPKIRREAEEEHYFASNEMQQDSERYRLMRAVLEDLDPRLPDLFDQAWFSATLTDCPPLSAWQEVVSEVQHRERVAGVVSNWQPLVMPAGVSSPEPEPVPPTEPARQPAAAQPQPEEEEPVQQPARLPVDPAPPPTIIQPPVVKPVPAPPSQPRPIQTQPPREAGGPVREWRPLTVPQQPPAQPSAFAGSRPIEIPVIPEPEPILPPAEEIEEPEPEPEMYSGEFEAEEPVLVEGEQVEDTYEAEYIGEDDLPGDWAEDDATYDEPLEQPYPPPDEISLMDDAIIGDILAGEDEDALNSGLLKPVLDLAYIDRRNRPNLAWSESPEALYYLLQEDDNPDFTNPKEHKIKGSEETRWSPSGPFWRRSGRVYFRVRAVSNDGEGPWSETVAVRLGQ